MKSSKNVAPASAPKAPAAPVLGGPTPPASNPIRTRVARVSKFEGKVLVYVPTPVVLGTNNGADVRRQKESRRTASRALLVSVAPLGLAFAEYLRLGGNAGDLARDVRKGATLALSADAYAARIAPAAPVAAPSRKGGKGGRKSA